jgi:hypothetical protein
MKLYFLCFKEINKKKKSKEKALYQRFKQFSSNKMCVLVLCGGAKICSENNKRKECCILLNKKLFLDDFNTFMLC